MQRLNNVYLSTGRIRRHYVIHIQLIGKQESTHKFNRQNLLTI
ncbi:hypothetical protein HMPREF9098_1626 [Kingella denitrificans ATCC 33394]|uniref:Uncharacterized protein n=1 Tax=Kingella denitrificans ATCC 33394 TaxID=888741 RepID=F0F0J1_9NEIS|nr:hypothetical protein HMPREF9098_1626 [Kingella denitrificans ATCC 33394]